MLAKHHRIRRLLVTASTLICGAVLTAPATSAHAQPADLPAHTSWSALADEPCDTVIGYFRKVKSGASFTHRGRAVELQNESITDAWGRAEITSGYRQGDQVWVDRSKKEYLASTHGVVSNADAQSQGWVQCGPFSRETSKSVNNRLYAARACARVENVSKCGRWYVD